jgi:hypothetical protein
MAVPFLSSAPSARLCLLCTCPGTLHVRCLDGSAACGWPLVFHLRLACLYLDTRTLMLYSLASSPQGSAIPSSSHTLTHYLLILPVFEHILPLPRQSLFSRSNVLHPLPLPLLLRILPRCVIKSSNGTRSASASTTSTPSTSVALLASTAMVFKRRLFSLVTLAACTAATDPKLSPARECSQIPGTEAVHTPRSGKPPALQLYAQRYGHCCVRLFWFC